MELGPLKQAVVKTCWGCGYATEPQGISNS